MRPHHCDRCGAVIENGPLLLDELEGRGSFPEDLGRGLTLRMPIRALSFKWGEVDFCVGCAKELLEGFMSQALPWPPASVAAADQRDRLREALLLTLRALGIDVDDAEGATGKLAIEVFEQQLKK